MKGYLVIERPITLGAVRYLPGEFIPESEIGPDQYRLLYEYLRPVELEVLGHD